MNHLEGFHSRIMLTVVVGNKYIYKCLTCLLVAERNMPLYGGIVGLLFGAGLVLFDLVTSDKPVIPVRTLSRPIVD